jgi:hypothetical protein
LTGYAISKNVKQSKFVNSERKEFLSVIQLPARVMAEEAAWLLGFAPHDIPVLVSAGLLKPLGHPPASGTKFFATAALLKLRDDINWLSRASDAIVRHWQEQNVRKSKAQNGHPVRPQAPIQDAPRSKRAVDSSAAHIPPMAAE